LIQGIGLGGDVPIAATYINEIAKAHKRGRGFSNHPFSFAGKWLSILKELIPGIVNVMMLYEPANAIWQGYLPLLEAVRSM
jgi:MFS family permease